MTFSYYPLKREQINGSDRGGFPQDLIYRRRDNMFASTLPTATPYCSIHRKFFLEPLQAWCSLPSTHIPCDHPELIEAPCDECMMLARRTFKAQFPSLYTTSMLKGLGKDEGSAPPRLAPASTGGSAASCRRCEWQSEAF